MQQYELLEHLEKSFSDQISFIGTTLETLTEEQSMVALDEENWSTKEITEHLNTYMRYYLPRIQKVLAKSKNIENQDLKYAPGVLPRYMIAQIKPEKKKKLKARPLHIPEAQQKSFRQVLTEFSAHMKSLGLLLNQARGVDLNKYPIAVSVMRILKFPLGAVLEFLISHNERHMLQIKTLLNK